MRYLLAFLLLGLTGLTQWSEAYFTAYDLRGTVTTGGWGIAISPLTCIFVPFVGLILWLVNTKTRRIEQDLDVLDAVLDTAFTSMLLAILAQWLLALLSCAAKWNFYPFHSGLSGATEHYRRLLDGFWLVPLFIASAAIVYFWPLLKRVVSRWFVWKVGAQIG
ncbi:MAG TPA: hypothetical protein VGE45_13130 [Chloroflexia bacterium]